MLSMQPAAAHPSLDATGYTRSPAPHPPARELVVDAGGIPISGLLAEPDRASPRALLVAVHGVGMHAGYFHTPVAPGLSFLELASQLGFTAWAPDRPGVGASAGLPNDALTMTSQAALLRTAIRTFIDDHDIGGGVVLVCHSYGLKVGLVAAADGVPALVGIDGSGTGLRLASRDVRRAHEAGPAWGPRALYPHETFEKANLPVSAVPSSRPSDASAWPEVLAAVGPQITVPLRFTFGEHEGFFLIEPEEREAFRQHFPNAASVAIGIQPDAGHNISLGWTARAHHLEILAFAEHCLVKPRLARDL
jgi:hypothetical protein